MTPQEDRRTETGSLEELHYKTDRQTRILERLERFAYGDPEDPRSTGAKGMLAEHGNRLDCLEKHQSKFYAILGTLGLAAIVPWLGKLFDRLFKS